jgi:hypothetical protein
VGTGVDGTVNVAATWDPDGPGPLPPRLIVGGDFLRAGGVLVRNVAQWDAKSWQPLGVGLPPSLGINGVLALTTHDFDADGPEFPRIVAGGDFDQHIAQWDGAAWRLLGDEPTDDWVSTLVEWSPPDAGAQNKQLVVGGGIQQAGGVPAFYIAMWSTLGPEILAQPLDADAPAGAQATFVVVARDVGEPAFQWRHDGVPLTDGPTGSGSHISGAHAATLIVFNVQPSDEGGYDVIVSTGCGAETSSAAALTVGVPSCEADWDANGVVNSTDVSEFINAWFTDQAKGTLVSDWDDNGVVNSTDVSAFINSWFADTAGGCGT